MNKKGISPLIGTVLLVAIVIAMILIIMPWVTRTIREQQTKTAEASRQFDCITKLNFELTGSPEKILVDNRGEVDLVKLTFRSYKTDGSVSTSTMEPTGTETLVVAAYAIEPASVSCATNVERVEAMATIMSESKPLMCADASRDYYC